MKRILLLVIIFFISPKGFTQSLNGQWRGVFDSNGDIVISGDNTTEYVLELNIKGKNVGGYSYSYFNTGEFVICSLSGTYNKKTQTVDVIETKRIKGNTGPDFSDCLQEHLLTYKKEGNSEVLTGSWRPANIQLNNCGTGSTTLIRKTLSKELGTYNKTKTRIVEPKVKIPVLSNHLTTNTKDSVKVNAPKQDSAIAVTTAPQKSTSENASVEVPSDINYEKRSNEVLQTIPIDSTTFTVDLYDNGAIDGDSISLFYNDKVIIFHKRLSDQAISVTLTMNTGREVNELTMYAENLGTIPPNTALMVITDGKKRYEVNVSSDLTTSGSIRFIHNTLSP
jgi:hypothetical protein